MKQRLQIHPFALFMPELSGEDRAAMRDDIRKHGVRNRVILFEGKVLDGRNRYEIATALGKEVPTENFYGTAQNALEAVASHNLHRRHLEPSQKAMVAAMIADELVRMEDMDANEAIEFAAEQTGASIGYAKEARRIRVKDKKAAKKILNGDTNIHEYKEQLAPQKVVSPRTRTVKCPHCDNEFEV